MIQLKDSEMKGTKFQNVVIQHNSSSPYGGLIKSYDSTIFDMVIENLKTNSSSDNMYRNVLEMHGGRIYQCSFDECSLSRDSYLYLGKEQVVQSDFSFSNFHSNYGWKNPGDRFAEQSQTQEEIFDL